jgi:hypothetical protein
MSGKKRCVSPEIKESNHHFYSFESLGDKIAFRVSRNNTTEISGNQGLLLKRLTKPIQDLEIELINGTMIKSKVESIHISERKLLAIPVSFTDHYFVIDQPSIEVMAKYPIKKITFGAYKVGEMDTANNWEPDKKEGVQISKWIKSLKEVNQ